MSADLEVWRHRSPKSHTWEAWGASSPPRPLPTDLASLSWAPNSSQLSHPTAKPVHSLFPYKNSLIKVSAALDLYVVQPGTESLILIPEPVAKPQLPEGHVSLPQPRFPCPLQA